MNYLKGWLVWFAIFLPFHGEESYLGTYGSEINLMNIDKVWAQNITGRNIIVAVVDDGVNYNHQDLNPNYESSISYDFVGNDMLPMPEGKMGHGTKCAGVIAAHIGGICRTGVAYNAKLAGIRIFNESFPDENRTAAGFEHMRNEIDIYSNSWGPSDNGYLIRTLGLREMQSLEQGVNHGRGGLGSIFVFSSGNGGLFGDSCAFDGYVNNINTIAIGAFSKKGVPQYAEHCSSVMAAAYGDYVKTCSGRFSRCVDDFGRTSAAAAFASGIIALLLEANNNLTQRDVQHLIVRTSNPRTANINRREWAINGAGLMVHPAVGFGVLNAQRLVEVARNNWRTVPQQRDRSTELNNLPKLIFRGGTNFTFSFGDATESLKIKAIERVQVKVSLNFSPRAMMEMYIISPQGTKSQLLYTRMYDAITARKNYEGLVITTLHFWGECPAGEWTVLFKAAESMRSRGSSYGTLQKFTVTIYGTDQDPLLYNNVLPKDTIKCGGGNQLWKGYGSKCCESMWTYDPNYETCCPGTYEIVKIRSQCGSTPYNKCENICCNGILHNKFKNNATMSCCGKKSHDKKKTICCGEMLSKRYSCKKVYFWLAKYLYEAKCYGGRSVQYQFTAEQCKNRKILKKVCEDKWEFCKPYHCIILSSSQKTANCAKTCDLC